MTDEQPWWLVTVDCPDERRSTKGSYWRILGEGIVQATREQAENFTELASHAGFLDRPKSSALFAQELDVSEPDPQFTNRLFTSFEQRAALLAHLSEIQK